MHRALSFLCLLFSAQVCAAPPTIGQAAPNFRLQDQNGQWRSLEDYRGQWLVLYFYPKDNTPGCTTEACNFRDNIAAFHTVGATVVGISIDAVASHQKFAAAQQLPFTLLADEKKETAQAYGVLTKIVGLVELAKRNTFLIDPESKIAKHYIQVDPKTHAQTILEDIKALQQLSSATTENNTQ